jgi:hypothetical protein
VHYFCNVLFSLRGAQDENTIFFQQSQQYFHTAGRKTKTLLYDNTTTLSYFCNFTFCLTGRRTKTQKTTMSPLFRIFVSSFGVPWIKCTTWHKSDTIRKINVCLTHSYKPRRHVCMCCISYLSKYLTKNV